MTPDGGAVTEEALERLLAELGDGVPVPAEGRARVLAAAGRAPSAPVRAGRDLRPPRDWRPVLAVAAGLVLLVAGIATLARSGGGASRTASSTSGGPAAAAGAPAKAGSAAGAAGAAGSAGAPAVAPSAAGGAVAGGAHPAGPVPRAVDRSGLTTTGGARVVLTGGTSLQVRTGQVGPTMSRLATLAAGDGGYVASSRTDAVSPSPSGTARLRVPVARFAALQGQVKALGKVLSATSSGTDVTGQYVDLAARLRALSATRDNYVTLLSKANSIGDTLAVQSEIETVQTQIEQLQGEENLLADQSSDATLDVSVSEVPPPVPVAHPAAPPRSGLSQAFHEAGRHFAHGVEDIVAASGTLALLLLVFGGLALLGGLGWRVVRRRLV